MRAADMLTFDARAPPSANLRPSDLKIVPHASPAHPQHFQPHPGALKHHDALWLGGGRR
jgi:hypothetical protein